MELLVDPRSWLSFLTLAVLEVVLGIDNIIFLALLVDRLPPAQRRSARYLGSGFAMLTRIALLSFVLWVANIRKPLFTAFQQAFSIRDMVLLAGGIFLVVQSVQEIRTMLTDDEAPPRTGRMSGFWMIIVQVGIVDIVFSVDSVFTAIGLANRIEVMIAAIVVSVIVMLGVSSAVSRFINRYPTVKALALAFLVLIGVALVFESVHIEIPQVYLYSAIGVSAVVRWVILRQRG